MTWVKAVTLTGSRVRMEPLDLVRHWEGLLAIGLEPALWRYTLTEVRDTAGLKRYLDTAADELAQGRSLPFATIDLGSGRVAGCTRFGTIDERNRRVEIGWTWVGREFQRSHVNTEAKYLMLRHGFESTSPRAARWSASVPSTRACCASTRYVTAASGAIRSTTAWSIASGRV